MNSLTISQGTRKLYTIGIRRENKSVWERRCALTPREVHTILT